MRKILVSVIAIVAFLINPLYACYEPERDFEYGELEMRGALEGTWELTLGEQRMEVKLVQAGGSKQHSSTGFISSAAACSNRSFVRSAAACIDTSEMPIEALVGGVVAGTGHFRILGTRFERGEISLEIAGRSVHAVISPAGAVLELSAGANLERKRF
jgi:hypothetical protein